MDNIIEKFEKVFQIGKEELNEAYNRKDIVKTLSMLRFLSYVLYETKYGFYDEDVERFTAGISESLLGRTVINDVSEEIVFYDSFGVIDRGLAEIYIEGLLVNEYRVKWIIFEFAAGCKNVCKKYENRKNLEIIVIPTMTIARRMEVLRDIIAEIKPKAVFMYFTPDDIVGIGTFSTFSGKIKKYLIDLTDHTFWAGVVAADKIIGFRDFGCSLAVQQRNCTEDKICMLPYYPNVRNEYEYQKMPFDDNVEYVFAGGAPYKIEGSDLFEVMVRYILDNHSNINFVYAGPYKNEILNNLERLYPNRFYFVSERPDLDEVMKHARFYLSTYPIFGALMIQYALQNNCIPVTYVEENIEITNPGTMLLKPDEFPFIINEFNELKHIIDKIIEDDEFFVKSRKRLKDQVISKSDFDRNLKKLVEEGQTDYGINYYEVDVEKILNIYKKNVSFEDYERLVIQTRNEWIKKRLL